MPRKTRKPGWFPTEDEFLHGTGNLQVFFVRYKTDGCKHIEYERSEAQQEMINHRLGDKTSEVE